MMRGILLLLALSACGAPPLSQTQSTACYKASSFLCAVEQAITRKTNEYRYRPLIDQSRLGFVAREWSAAQAEAGTISHTGFPQTREQWYRAEFQQLDVTLRAENVAMSSWGGKSADDVAAMFVNMWWRSPGHRTNMLGNFRYMGVGVVRQNGTFFATEIFAN